MRLPTQLLAQQAFGRAVRHTVEVFGIITPYWVYPASTPKAKTVVFFHGYRGNHNGLEAIAGALHDFKVIIPDLPGFGESEGFADNEYTMANYAGWAAAFIKALKLEKASIMAHSFGTMVIAQAAGRGLLGTVPITLVNPIARVNRGNVSQAFISPFIPAIAKLGEPVGRAILSSPIFVYVMSVLLAKTKDRKLRSWIHRQHLQYFSMFANTKVIGDGFIAGVKNPVNLWVTKIKNPTLMFITDRDTVTTYADYLELVKEFPSAKVFEIRGIGHLTHYETPNEVAAEIRDFLSTQR